MSVQFGRNFVPLLSLGYLNQAKSYRKHPKCLDVLFRVSSGFACSTSPDSGHCNGKKPDHARTSQKARVLDRFWKEECIWSNLVIWYYYGITNLVQPYQTSNCTNCYGSEGPWEFHIWMFSKGALHHRCKLQRELVWLIWEIRLLRRSNFMLFSLFTGLSQAKREWWWKVGSRRARLNLLWTRAHMYAR